MIGRPVSCQTCGRPTMMIDTGLCDLCWHIEGALAPYLRHGGDKARQFVEAALRADDERRKLADRTVG